MPWQEVSTMALRQEFVMLASQEGANRRGLCRRFGISPPTGYKWLERYQREGLRGLEDRSRQPQHSPNRSTPVVEEAILVLRAQHPAWGGRKIRQRLLTLGHASVPSASTITAILHRHHAVDPFDSAKHRPFRRFERAAPNQLWQMDFKGHFPLEYGRCHPLTVLDDHSRFNLGLEACGDEQGGTVQGRLTGIFRRYGLPEWMIMDNGSPWGSDAVHRRTPLTVWLLRLGVGVSHGAPYHPQSQGKDERFHRTLKAEVLRGHSFRNLTECQAAFDAWRTVYNLERPHEALGMAPPASRYQVSPRPFPETLPPVEYGPDDLVRKVQADGTVSVHGKTYLVSKAFRGYPVGLRPTAQDHIRQVYFCHHKILAIDIRYPLGGG